MGENDSGTAELGGIGDDRAKRKIGAGFIALMTSQMEASRLIIDMRDPQALQVRSCLTEAAAEERLGSCKPIELQRVFGTLIPHAGSLGTHDGAAHLNRLQNGYPLWMDMVGVGPLLRSV